jgi:hypothetical protein
MKKPEKWTRRIDPVQRSIGASFTQSHSLSHPRQFMNTQVNPPPGFLSSARQNTDCTPRREREWTAGFGLHTRRERRGSVFQEARSGDADNLAALKSHGIARLFLDQRDVVAVRDMRRPLCLPFRITAWRLSSEKEPQQQQQQHRRRKQHLKTHASHHADHASRGRRRRGQRHGLREIERDAWGRRL